MYNDFYFLLLFKYQTKAHRVVWNVLERQHERVGDLLTDGLQERPESGGVGSGPTVATHQEWHGG